ncbi:hypothetical protein NA56DRAFT_638772 [Hyaloscypha hepaticicola]|uniref:Uncharacterized protein n=1 Tax=Hyaloscypha hepaticicola TaxID=2082293 RepID=A0A2J6PFM3_9HELO|nr:hypothetical protein NA56DRAFT_638772 [Hyaloscypha hepaticicola]
MRVLNTATLRFEQILDSELDLDKNQYAILSHRWFDDEDEVSYEDLLHSSSKEIFSKGGYAKIKGFCKLASDANCRYGWIDTCCINKGNSSELSEAINSMYLWYSCSKICIAYLGDVPDREFKDSEWFDRGWTLQELIAPKEVLFFDQNWSPLGTKSQLLAELSCKTRIPQAILNHTSKPFTCSVAQRFSWAATRITKRAEDRAYSLMGLFDINMPMIYGERENAFIRLQQHIIQKSKDESIFAWTMEQQDATSKPYSGLYAPSPSVYINCSNVVQTPGSMGFSESNGELSLRSRILPNSPGTCRAVLHCAEAENRVFIVLGETSDEHEYVRVRDPGNVSQGVIPEPQHDVREQLIRVLVAPHKAPISIFYGFWLRTLKPLGHERCRITSLSNSRRPEPGYICQQRYDQGNTGIVCIKPKDNSNSRKLTTIRWIKFGFDEEYNPVIWLATDHRSARLRELFERARASQRKSPEYKEAFNEDLLRSVQGKFAKSYTNLRLPDKPVGMAMTLRVDGNRELEELEIEGMKISVQLQPYRSPSIVSRQTTDVISGFRLDPDLVWTVDITETRMPLTTKSFFCCCFLLACCPCVMLCCRHCVMDGVS